MSPTPQTPAAPTIPPNTRSYASADAAARRRNLSKDEQLAAAGDMARLYNDPIGPCSIQDIADATGRSYGTVHRYLVQLAGVQPRPRGGVHPRRARTRRGAASTTTKQPRSNPGTAS